MKCTHDWLQQSLRIVQLMTLVKSLIFSTLDIEMINDIMDELWRLDLCNVEDVLRRFNIIKKLYKPGRCQAARTKGI